MEPCVFCRLLAGDETEWNGAADVVWQDERTTAFVSPRTWADNEGNAIVIPNAHVQGLAEADEALLGAVYATAARVAAAMRSAYGCDGISLRQHDGAAAGQEIDHLHVHVFPRWPGDRLYERTAEHRFAPRQERAAFALRLRDALNVTQRS